MFHASDKLELCVEWKHNGVLRCQRLPWHTTWQVCCTARCDSSSESTAR